MQEFLPRMEKQSTQEEHKSIYNQCLSLSFENGILPSGCENWKEDKKNGLNHSAFSDMHSFCSGQTVEYRFEHTLKVVSTKDDFHVS